MSLTLYTYPGNYRAWKCQVAAAYNGVTLDVQDSKELKTLFNKPPVLATPQGHLFESNAIAGYIAGLNGSTNLNGSTYFESAQVKQWIDFTAFEIEPQRAVWLLPILGVIEFNGKAYAAAKKDLKEALKVMNTHLLKNTFLVGNQVTLADITCACALVELFQTVLDNNFRKGLENLVRWFNTVSNQKEFLAVVGEVKMTKKEQRAPVPKKKPQDQQKKADKPAQAKKPSKPKNPLDELPKSSMSLDATKKLLFAAKGPTALDRGNPEFWPAFWKTFDDQGYSFWSACYDNPTSVKEFWKAQNKCGFYVQRMDALRKYGMGVLNLLGESEEANYFEVTGCFLVRGTKEIPFELKDVPDSDFYTFTKLPTGSDAEKKAIENYFRLEKGIPTHPKFGKKGLKTLDRYWFK